jgi:predicted ArsR family transcriptional regulator
VAAVGVDLLKALGDNTRYAIYLELVRSPRPLATAEIAESLALHPNTVRPHLERMREVGLLDVRTESPTGVGRPQHLYSPAPDAPSLGLEPPTYPVLARMLLTMAAASGLGPEDAAAAGRVQGRDDALLQTDAASCLEAIVQELDRFGFDPAVDGELTVDDAGDDMATAVIGFAHCPFRELAEAHPDLVCSLHRGLVEGFMAEFPEGAVDEFHPLTHRTPCQVTISYR